MRTTPARRMTVGAVLGAALTLVLATTLGNVGDGGLLGSSHAAHTPTSAASAASPASAASRTSATPEPSPFRAPVGTCLTWSQDDASDARRVPCTQPHLFEITGTITLYRAYGPDAPFPTEAQWRDLVQRRCTAAAQDYLNGKFDPEGRYSVGAIKPSRAAWRNGDRTMRCGLQAVGNSGTVYPTTGSVRHVSQANVHEPGTCLGIDGKAIGDPVDCSKPHAVEVVAVVHLGKAFEGDGYPKEDKQDKLLADKCAKLAAEYAGGENVVRKKGLTVFWQTLSRRSWQAGTRKVECRLGAPLPDDSGFAAITGSVKGKVTIADEPAPPMPNPDGPASTPLPTPSPPASPSPSASPPSGR